MNELALVKTKRPDLIEGIYRLRHTVWSHTRAGKPYVRLILEDQHNAIPAYFWNTENLRLPAELSCVQVRGRMRFRRDGVVADLKELRAGTRRPEDIVRLIPRSLCPLPWLVPFLEVFLGSVRNPALRQFCSEVLSDDSITFPFVACPASLGYHHNYPGGLLRHSVECAQMIERYEEFTPEQKELGMVAALFHDIGKILTMTPQMELTSLGRTLEHDKLTLEILAPYLRRLDSEWPQGSAQLRYLLTWRPGRTDKGIPKTPLANAVVAADRVSAGVDAR